jgi:hypothetical protein
VTKEPIVDVDDDDQEDLQTQVLHLTAQVQMLLSAQRSGGGQGLSEDHLERMLARVAQISAEAQERAANPSNKTHPAISVFSFPEGDRARPRWEIMPFKCKMTWVGADLDYDNTRADELELLNLAEPGEYRFRRINGVLDTLTITADRAPSGAVDKLHFTFPTRENRDTLPSMADMLRSAFHVKSAEQQEIDALKAQLAAALATSGAVQVGA